MLIDRADDKPWDAQIAYKLIYPLRKTFVNPNYFAINANVYTDSKNVG